MLKNPASGVHEKPRNWNYNRWKSTNRATIRLEIGTFIANILVVLSLHRRSTAKPWKISNVVKAVCSLKKWGSVIQMQKVRSPDSIPLNVMPMRNLIVQMNVQFGSFSCSGMQQTWLSLPLMAMYLAECVCCRRATTVFGSPAPRHLLTL